MTHGVADLKELAKNLNWLQAPTQKPLKWMVIIIPNQADEYSKLTALKIDFIY